MISVIVPFFNSEKYLPDLIHDLLQQTYKDLEIILIDDGATDSSGAIAQHYQTIDNRIHYTRTEHCGVSAARNLGLKLASGMYIRFLDVDDRIEADSMEKMLLSIEHDKEIDLVCGRFNTNCASIVYFGPSGSTGKKDINTFIQDFSFAPRTFYYGVVWNKLYRRELIAQNNIHFDEGIDWCEDFLFNLKYYEHCKYVFYLQESIYKYCVHEESLNSTANERIGIEQIDKMDHYRYQRAVDFIERVGCNSRQFRDTWAYLKIMKELIAVTGFFSGRGLKHMDIRKRFHAFKEMLTVQDNRELINRRYADDSDMIVKMIYRSMNRERYLGLFVFYGNKGLHECSLYSSKKIVEKTKKKGS